MNRQRLLKYNTHQTPADLVISNMLDAYIQQTMQTYQVYTEPGPREMESLRIKAFVGKHHLLMLRMWKKIMQPGNRVSYHLGILGIRKNYQETGNKSLIFKSTRLYF